MPEHLEILGPSGSGKSYFQNFILKERAAKRKSHITIIVTKNQDRTSSEMGWPITDRFPPRGKNMEQHILWIKREGLGPDAIERQADRLYLVMQQLMVADANRIVVFDEIAYVHNVLGLKTELGTFFREGRSHGLTVVANTQRPVGTDRTMHSETSWIVAFKPKDEDDAERCAQLFGNRKFYKDVLMSLNKEKYEFLIYNTLTGKAVITSLPKRRNRSTGNRR